jgi:hypothetical protein
VQWNYMSSQSSILPLTGDHGRIVTDEVDTEGGVSCRNVCTPRPVELGDCKDDWLGERLNRPAVRFGGRKFLL